MEFISSLHARMLHVVYLLAALSIVFPLVNAIRKQPVSPMSKWVVRSYTFIVTLQLLLGLTQLIVKWNEFGGEIRFRLEHAFLMLVAVGCVHLAPRYMKRSDATGARNTTYLMVASLALIILGATLISALR